MESFRRDLSFICFDENELFDIITTRNDGKPVKTNILSTIIGYGSYGSVYKVYFTDYGLSLLTRYFIQKRIYNIDKNPIDTPVAIKLFRETRHFESERNIARMLPIDPCLPLYFGCMQTISDKYLILYKLIKGDDLNHHAKYDERFYSETYGPFFDKRIQIGNKLINVMKLIHHRGIYHRDIKPSNIIVENMIKDNIYNPVLIDFGLASTVQAIQNSRIDNNVSNPLLDKYMNISLLNIKGTSLYMNPYIICKKYNPNTIHETHGIENVYILGKNGVGESQITKYYLNQTYQTFLEKNDYWAMAVTLYKYYTDKMPPFMYIHKKNVGTLVVAKVNEFKKDVIVDYELYMPSDIFDNIPNDILPFFKFVFTLEFFDNMTFVNGELHDKPKQSIYPEKFIDQKLHMNRKFKSNIIDPLLEKNRDYKKLFIENKLIN